MKPSPKKLKETKNIYYTVVEHLISEGYATDSDSADNIIKGMSDEWFETIIEDIPSNFQSPSNFRSNIVKTPRPQQPVVLNTTPRVIPTPPERAPRGATVSKYDSSGKEYTHIQR